MNQMAKQQSRAVEIKGRRYSLMSLKLLNTEFDAIRRSIRAATEQAPGFFKNTPVIVDFSDLDVNIEFDFNLLFKIVRQQQLLPVAVCGIPTGLREKMQSIGVPIVERAISASERLKKTDTPPVTEAGAGRSTGNTVVVELPARGAEALISEYGDLIIIGDTEPDSELIAAGNVHVYGTLRGRVLAGVQGDKGARIFCSSLAADHVSIAGVGLSMKGVASQVLSAPLQVTLKNDQLIAVPFG